jgi:hypothetical protein
MDDFGMKIHPDKGEEGSFFLQMRVDESCKRGQFYTPSPRVISKLF